MKKKLFSLFAMMMITAVITLAQIPQGYYDSTQGLSGSALKTELNNIIKGHTSYPYSSTGTDVWDILKEADKDPNNSDNVLCIYSKFSMNAAAEYASGAGWNREHIWAKSRGDFGTTKGAGTDLHHLRAADVSTNSARNNRNFDEAPDPYVDGSGVFSGPTPSFTSSVDWIWEPPADVKGDIARMLFYMTTRYEGFDGEPDLELVEEYLDASSKLPGQARLSTLLTWHLADPVDDAERTRNDVVYSYQNNRNPFIDHPEFVCSIYSCGAELNTAPVFTSTTVTAVSENIAYTYTITASDSDNDNLTISIGNLPSWLIFTDNQNGTASLSGTPLAANVGTHAISLTVSDGKASAVQNFNIIVSAESVNSAPVFTSTAITGATENIAYTYNITVSDSDKDNLMISAGILPSWMSFADNQDGTALLSGMPLAMQIGTHAVSLTVSDGKLSSVQNFNIIVSAGDQVGFASDLFFSEYIEGSSNNKAIEVANFTGTNVDLTQYTIKKQTNGAGSWSSGLSLTGTLANQDVYVAANSSAVAEVSNQADYTGGVSELTFNGNDALGLFKNNVLIDIIGEFSAGTANFANDVTLRRKSSVSKPNTTFDKALEWDSFAQNTFSGLGTHVFDGGAVTDPDTEKPSLPANLAYANLGETSFDISWLASSDNIAVTEYEVFLNDVSVVTQAGRTYSFSNLNENTLYTVKVVAKDEAGNISNAATLAVTTLARPTSQVLIYSNFEAGWDNWIDGGADARLYSGSRSYQGNNSINLQDNSSSKSAMTSPEFNLTAYNNIDIEFFFYAYSMEANENFFVKYYDGVSWKTIGDYVVGIDFENNNYYSANLTITNTDYAFPANAKFRIQCDASANADDIYIDEVKITASTIVGTKSLMALGNAKSVFVKAGFELEPDIEGINIYPNPASDYFNVELVLNEEVDLEFQVFDVQGRLVLAEKDQNCSGVYTKNISVSHLGKGVYVLLVSGEEIKESKRLVIK